MEATSTQERELKLSAPSHFRLPDLGDPGTGLSVSAEEVKRYTAVYYDTRDLRLTRWDCGLRFRSSDGWTVKLPDGDGGAAVVRREFRFAGSPARPPAAAVDLLSGITRGAELEPVTSLRTIRRRVAVYDASGSQLVEVTNDHVAVLDGRRVARRFREVEVEFAGHCPREVVEGIVARLRRAGTGPSHRVAKQVRALGLESGVLREVAIPDVYAEDSAAQLIRLALARSVTTLVQRDAGVRVDEDIEDVHQMRVATRRLRSLLRTFRPLLEEGWVGPLLQDLRWLGGSLGLVRDADVLSLRLRAAAMELPQSDRQAAKDLLDRLSEARRRNRQELLEALRSARYRALLDRLVEAARSPRLQPEAQQPGRAVLTPLARRRWRRLAKAVRRLEAEPTPEALHDLRIRAKHTRYAAEALAPIFGKPARRFAKAARGVQQVLGDHQDAVVSTAWLRDAAGEVPREAAYVAGVLAAREDRHRAEALARWPAAWERVSDRRLRDWLES